MGAIAKIALVILGISFTVFVAFFGRLPVFRHTPVAWLHRLICVSIPNGILALDQKVTSGRLTSCCWNFGQYIMYDRHPTVLVFFLVLLVGGEYLFLPTAWPQMSLLHRIAGSIAVALPYVFLYLAAASDPGTIDASNHAREMARYPYDFVLFHPGAVCRTCNILKPARSKHCSVCKRCVSRLDHHCIFINNCVGSNNNHWFLLLILATGVLCSYGAILGTSLMGARIRQRYPDSTLLPPHLSWDPKITFNEWLVIWGWALQDGIALGSVTLLVGLLSPLVWGLFWYNIWLVYSGTTTNESLKWSDWQLEMNDGFAWQRRLPQNRAKDLRLEPAWTRWPAEPEQILVRTEDGRPPEPDSSVAGEGEWERPRKLRELENVYDIGFWGNIRDIFQPFYMFRDRHTPIAEGRIRRPVKKKRRARD